MRSWRPVGVTIPSHPVDNRVATPAASQGKLVRLVRLERTLYDLSSRSLYRLGYRRIQKGVHARLVRKMEDTAGNDPAPDGLRDRRSAN